MNDIRRGRNPSLLLTGERTTPQVKIENYWFLTASVLCRTLFDQVRHERCARSFHAKSRSPVDLPMQYPRRVRDPVDHNLVWEASRRHGGSRAADALAAPITLRLIQRLEAETLTPWRGPGGAS